MGGGVETLCPRKSFGSESNLLTRLQWIDHSFDSKVESRTSQSGV